MSDLERERREMDMVLRKPGLRPDAALRLTRRTFIRRALLTGAAATAAACGPFPLINTMDVAYGADSAFRFAWISDTHLYPKSLNTRFVDKATRAIDDVSKMDPPADFLIFGGDIAQLGRAEELALGNQLLGELKIDKHFIPGEHDWYYDMGAKWTSLYGKPNWSFDHKGVRFVGLDTISRAPDYWSATKMSPEDRMGAMATLDGNIAGPWAGVGSDQIEWLSKTLSDWDKSKPVIVFSHNPLYEVFPPWNFWVRDWREVNEVLGAYSSVVNIHGHVHQVLYNEIGSLRSYGMLATSWPWPYPPTGVPQLTRPMIRVDPGDPFDGVGWGEIPVSADNKVDPQYKFWGRKQVYAEAQVDSGTGDNDNQRLRARIADLGWYYPDK